jgi:hypothetical protein
MPLQTHSEAQQESAKSNPFLIKGSIVRAPAVEEEYTLTH